MYIPKYFKMNDYEEVLSFMKEHAFVTLVTTQNGIPIASHIPVHLSEKNDVLFITGHLAYGNPQWRTLDQETNVLIIFQGPHAYISSSWYQEENVPTWNYQSVHVYGDTKLLDDDELRYDLKSMMLKYEQGRENAYTSEERMSRLIEKELSGVKGFKLKVTDIQAQNKLSQNRKTEDYMNIIEQLPKEQTMNSTEIAHQMSRLKQLDIK
ncbi:FMN-binding negative transcriptional regulator [Exiguobacterium indicum]|uniref:FMN-binding negative transcriptional regulator n=1 Tax=Exiguobacterium indicum TaxID=296995 RepID=A0ABU8ELM0_9BACL